MDFTVSTLGLPDQEMRLVKTIFNLSGNRPQGCYKLSQSPDPFASDILIINEDDKEAMSILKMLSGLDRPVPVLVTSHALVHSTENYFMRPFSPTKVLSLLDKVAESFRTNSHENDVFKGKAEDGSAQDAPVDGQRYSRALVVDDSPTVRRQLELELRASNIHVDSVETGEEGLHLLGNNFYDIIFLDVVLPGADGYEICKNIKRNSISKKIPVIMLTSKSSPFDRVRGSLAGCDSYLTKPVDYEKFKQVLKEYKV